MTLLSFVNLHNIHTSKSFNNIFKKTKPEMVDTIISIYTLKKKNEDKYLPVNKRVIQAR